MYARLMRGLARRSGLRVFRFFARPLHPEPVARSGFELRHLSLAEVLVQCGDGELDLRESAVRDAYARGDFCAGAFEGHVLAGYCWLAFAPLPHLDGVCVRFRPDVAWLYKSFVRAAYRGRGLAARLYRFPDQKCAALGRRTSVICVESHNGPSIGAARRAGYTHAGYAAYLRRAGRLSGWYSPGTGAMGVRFFDRGHR